MVCCKRWLVSITPMGRVAGTGEGVGSLSAIRISRVDSTMTNVPLPEYATAGSSGMDIRAAVHVEREFIVDDSFLNSLMTLASICFAKRL